MVNYAVSATRVIPSHVTKAQAWSALKDSARNPVGFGGITECTILSESENGTELVRKLVRMGKEYTQVVTLFEPTWYKAKSQDPNSEVTIILSSDKEGVNYITFTFHWIHPDVKAGSEQDKQMAAQYEGIVNNAVESAVQSMDGRNKV
ncbi:hypothetical protein JAAARDRAFT_205427 [Jaapia argillacea MUCL 33604]|uniref:Bet v I/Major latex protein domain-containing protein n=1 Tax=Jaapia argillacea MUCL 33604 TaxID=933084 RepID=A0A067Q0A8_9AGAM|nr:hypothetical protein JAAARDRAFT_205427 [Jaapia argillacea MUCL 33604]